MTENTNIPENAGSQPDAFRHPGVALTLDAGTLRVATPEDVRHDVETFVLIHGAHSEPESESIQKASAAIRSASPTANVLLVDWSYGANFNMETFSRDAKFFMKTGALVMRASPVGALAVLAGSLAGSVIKQLVPVEQAAKIPEVAVRVAIFLFSSSPATFQTDGKTATYIGLGLDPSRTHVIGHSHGAHVGGLACRHVMDQMNSRVRRLTLLDTSTRAVHLSGKNALGNGWDHNVADFVDAYRTSTFCSSAEIYGDVNVFFHEDKSTTPSEEKSENRLQKELRLHSQVIDYFIAMTRDPQFLARSFPTELMTDPALKDYDGRWIDVPAPAL